MVSPIQQKTTREIEIDKFITHRSWRKYMASPVGATEEVRAGHAEGQAEGTCLY